MMNFEIPPPREKKTRRGLDHAVILMVAAGSLAVFSVADDAKRGPAELGDAAGFIILFVMLGYFLGWLHAIWRRTDGTRLEAWIIPLFFVLIMVYLYFCFRGVFVQPDATAITVIPQLVALVVLSMRSR